METSPPTTIGPYDVLATLGKGGMGIVYRVRHRETGDIHALKTVRVLHEGMAEGIRREIQALANIHHPRIVRIVEEGLHGGRPWYAMELVDGMTLRHWHRQTVLQMDDDPPVDRLTADTDVDVATDGNASDVSDRQTSDIDAIRQTASTPGNWWTHKLATVALGKEDRDAALPSQPVSASVPSDRLVQTLTIIHRLCPALAYLHGQGIVHRDLKPDNVLVRPDGTPIIMDFGMISLFGGQSNREKLSVTRGTVGTVAYMAPEQISGRPVDARTDLYAMGIILYELLTGRLPFWSDSIAGLLHAHLHQPPYKPSVINPEIPAPLDRLVLRLLAKRPRKRLGYADDLARELEQLGAQCEDNDHLPTPRTYLYRPDFEGRDVEMKILRQRLRLLRAGKGGMVCLQGESGVGKTRLVGELGREAGDHHDIRVLTGEFVDTEQQPLQGWRKPLRYIADRCHEMGAEETERLIGDYREFLVLYDSTFAMLPGPAPSTIPRDLPPSAARTKLFQGLYGTLQRLSNEQPMLIIVDDLQWADDLSLQLIDYLLHEERLANTSLLLLCTVRSEHLDDRLLELINQPSVVRLGIHRLKEETVAAIIGDMLALDPAPEVFSRFLTKHSEGNPFFVAEYLQSAVERGLLWRGRNGEWQVAGSDEASNPLELYKQLPIPVSLQELVGERLHGLADDAMSVLNAAAIVGREAQTLLLWHVTQLSTQSFMTALERLMRRQIIEQSGPDSIRFAHDKIREVAVGLLERPRRSRLHRRIAEALEALHGTDTDDHAAALARHWKAAGVLPQARHYLLVSARIARRRYAQGEAERFYKRFLRLSPVPTRETIETRNELAYKICSLDGRIRRAFTQLQRAIQEARLVGDSAAEGESLRARGIILRDVGRLADAALTFQRALVLQERLGDDHAQGWTLASIALLKRQRHQSDDARQYFERALAIHRRLGNRQNEAQALYMLALFHHDMGKTSLALRHYEQALAVAEESGNNRLIGSTLTGLARLKRQTGAPLSDVLVAIDQAEAMLSDLGYLMDLGLCWVERGHLQLASNRSAADCLDRLSSLTHMLNVGPKSRLQRAIDRLNRAEIVFQHEPEERLYHGERYDDLPEALRSTIAQKQQS